MTAKQYEKISAPFRSENRTKWLKITNKLVTALGFTAYPLLLIYLYMTATEKLFAAVTIPASGFMLLTLVRKKINRPRPYVSLDINPIIHKDKQGNSMPSRHVFSMTMIAASWYIASPVICAVLMVFSVILALIRVIGGIHYPSDVIAGALCALVWAVIGFGIML